MMEKLDKFAVNVYNWIIVNTIAIVIYLVLIVLNIFGNSISGEPFYPMPSFNSIKDAIKEYGGIKND